MLNKNMKTLLIILVVGMVMMGCNLLSSDDNSTDVPDAATAVALTLQAQLTQNANNITNTPQAPSPTATTISPTATPYPTYTPYPSPTKTQAPTATPIPCNRAAFIGDVTVDDGSLFISGSQFSKEWRIKNAGSCDWTSNYELVFYSGDKMDGASVSKLNKRVEPGETIDVSVDLTAPDDSGEYLGYWMLRTSGGSLFGLGTNSESPFWVDIKVIDPDTTFVYGFSENICEASWKENGAPTPCQGVVGPEDNVVRLVDSFRMEDGTLEDEVSLWMNLGKNGRIEGTYPAIEVQTGDHFVTSVGCIEDSDNCHARFELSYQISGSSTVTQLDTWEESYDEKITEIDVDLSSLDGESVKFILTTKSLTSSSNTEVFWFVPRIINP